MAKKKSIPKKNKKERQENIIILGMFIAFVAIIGVLFYLVKTYSQTEDVVALVNGEEITLQELDWWYRISILPQYRDSVTKKHFLVFSLIPQSVLIQEAKNQNIRVTEDEVEKIIGLSIINNGLTFDEFDDQLNERGVTRKDVKESFRVRAIIIDLLEKENIDFDGEQTSFDENDRIFQVYVDGLVVNSEIEIQKV